MRLQSYGVHTRIHTRLNIFCLYNIAGLTRRGLIKNVVFLHLFRIENGFSVSDFER